MQSLLNICIDSIALAAAAYLAIGFVLSLTERFVMPRRKASPGQLEIDFTAAVPTEPEILTNPNVAESMGKARSQTIAKLPVAPVVTQLPMSDPWDLPVELVAASPAPLFPPVRFLLTLPAVAPIALLPAASDAAQTDWATMTPEQLRRECQQRGKKWRNARADGKHLRKAEMIAALVAA